MSIKVKLIFILISLLIFIGCDLNKPKLNYNTHLDKDKTYYVVYMAGQSNMAGLGDIGYLDNRSLPKNITFFNYSVDTRLKDLSYNFGPEVGLAKKLNEEFPHLNFIFIKYAVSGSLISQWLPNVKTEIANELDFGNIYGKFLKMSDSITKNHKTENLAFLWMQGESDAIYKSTSNSYEDNFKQLIENVRRDFKDPNLPILYGKVNPNSNDFKYVSNIQLAQKNIADSILKTFLIDTENTEKQKDSLHYSSLGLLNLGEEYGAVLSTIIKKKNNKPHKN